MSRTFSIFSPETKLALWIGQGTTHRVGWYLYNGAVYIQIFEAFLALHAGKELRFIDDECLPDDVVTVEGVLDVADKVRFRVSEDVDPENLQQVSKYLNTPITSTTKDLTERSTVIQSMVWF
jgi:hypothetical protein